MAILLAVDVGGTKTELALFNCAALDFAPVRRQVVACAGHGGLEEIIAAFLAGGGPRPEYACLGVAGIVEGGSAKITHLPWRLDEGKLAQRFDLDGVRLVNDMTALCAALTSLADTDLLELQPGQPVADGTRAVIAPGTGLGEGYLLASGAVFLPQGSEGGHCDFAPATDEQMELLSWLDPRKRPVSFEMVCSGLGIPTLYAFCRDQEPASESAAVARSLQTAEDKTPIIIDGALASEPCPLCRRTLDLFLSILGSEAGNLALKLYALGGLYLGGGILPRLAGRISFSPMLDAFCRKGRMAELMTRVPLKLILKRDVVLSGAAAYGRQLFAPSK